MEGALITPAKLAGISSPPGQPPHCILTFYGEMWHLYSIAVLRRRGSETVLLARCEPRCGSGCIQHAVTINSAQPK